MWKLVIEDDEGKRTVVPMSRDTYTVGRREGNSIRLTERNVSRQHAIFMRRDNNGQGGTVILTDLESYNGVFVNGLRIASEQELAHGDLVQIGDYRIILEDDTVVASISSSGTIDLKATVPGHGTARSQAAQLLERPNRLVMLAGPMPGTEFPLVDSPTMTVGRAEDASISINHNSVSRHHCEIHSLGGGRFEIVDKGSSNGVRVNGAELRRGIIEANDVIELGDVRLKFIGAGQVFRPGATESQRLSAIGDRATNLTVSDSSALGILPYAVFGTIVAFGTLCAWLVYHPRPVHDESVGMTATAPVKTEPAASVPPVGASAVPGVPSPVPSDLGPGPEGNAASEEHGDEHRAPVAAPDEAIPPSATRPGEAAGKTSTGSRGADDSEVPPATKPASSAGSNLPVVPAPAVPSPSARPAPRAMGPDWKQLMSDGEYEKAKPELMRRVFGSKKPNHEEFDALRNLCRLKSMLDEACLRRLEQMELTDPEAAATPGAPTTH